MANVRFYSGTRAQYDSLVSHNPLALYFCDDTGELFKGDICLSDGIRIVPTRADLPEHSCAADGVVYFIAETKSGFMVSPDRTEWLQTIYAPVTDAYSIPEEEMYTTVTTVGAVRDIEAKIYQRIEEIASSGGGTTNLTPVDGSLIIKDNTIDIGISTEPGNALTKKADGLYVGTSTSGNYAAGLGLTLVDGTFSVKIADQAHGLTAVNGALTINLATKDSDGAMSKEDKRILDAIPYVYEARKYDISSTPNGTIVNYGEKEIRIMCPADAEFTKQSVGEGGDPNSYYVTFKTYVPDDSVVGYIEHLGDQVDGEVLTNIVTDEYGRRYQPTWLAVAKYDESTSTWNYYGANSTVDRFIGWDYQIDWYNADNVRIATDSIRINLSNEDCHDCIRPYYGPDNDIFTDVVELQETVVEIQEAYSWGEM